MKMRIEKYAVLVDNAHGPLSVLVDDLKRLEFRVALVPECAAASAFMNSFPKLGLVVINAVGKQGASEFAQRAQQMHPGLPIVLLEESACVVSTAAGNSRAEGPIDAKRLAKLVADALLEQSYPEHVLSGLAFAIEEAMAGFDNHVVTGQAYLRATNGAIAELTALLPFSGRQVSGYLAVGSSRETAERLHQKLFPQCLDFSEEDLSDLLGEVCNRAIGRFHELLEARGLSFNFGVSLYLTNKSNLRAAQDHPALVLEFEGPAGNVLVELFLDGLVPSTTLSGAPDGPKTAGEFVLL